jgi:putative PIG3 family NAD(P)H quinone oxidoreductase
MKDRPRTTDGSQWSLQRINASKQEGKMKAIVLDNDQNMLWQDYELPQPGPGEVRIKIAASAVNRADLLQRRGFYPPPPGASEIMGLECAGEIESIGEGVDRWQIGDRVCALLAGGGYAEYTVAPAGSVLPIPTGFSFEQAAALPEVFATAWLNLFIEAGLVEGEKVVLHAGASGVGTAGIQLCRSFGNPCFVTVGSDQKLDQCLTMGAAAGSNRHQEPFLEKAKTFAGEQGVDVILDPVGGAYLTDNVNLLGVDGRLVLIGLMGGGVSEIQLPLVLAKRLTIIGSTLRARAIESKAAIMSSMEEKVWPRLESGEIQAVIDTVMPIAEAGAGHDLVAADGTFGKVVLKV